MSSIKVPAKKTQGRRRSDSGRLLRSSPGIPRGLREADIKPTSVLKLQGWPYPDIPRPPIMAGVELISVPEAVGLLGMQMAKVDRLVEGFKFPATWPDPPANWREEFRFAEDIIGGDGWFEVSPPRDRRTVVYALARFFQMVGFLLGQGHVRAVLSWYEQADDSETELNIPRRFIDPRRCDVRLRTIKTDQWKEAKHLATFPGDWMVIRRHAEVPPQTVRLWLVDAPPRARLADLCWNSSFLLPGPSAHGPSRYVELYVSRTDVEALGSKEIADAVELSASDRAKNSESRVVLQIAEKVRLSGEIVSTPTVRAFGEEENPPCWKYHKKTKNRSAYYEIFSEHCAKICDMQSAEFRRLVQRVRGKTKDVASDAT